MDLIEIAKVLVAEFNTGLLPVALPIRLHHNIIVIVGLEPTKFVCNNNRLRSPMGREGFEPSMSLDG